MLRDAVAARPDVTGRLSAHPAQGAANSTVRATLRSSAAPGSRRGVRRKAEGANCGHALILHHGAAKRLSCALASLIAQARQLLPRAVHDARDQELTWTQIGELLNTTAATAARRCRNKP
jgi:hypothetical protein